MTINKLTTAFLATLALAAPMLPAAVSAHAHLETANPAVYTNGVTPAELRLDFSEGLELAFTTVTLTAADGTAIATGAPALDPADATLLIVPLTGDLPAGGVKVDWKAVAEDGHKSEGSYSFTVAP
ncbi:MAG TPA: copper homeostasis periplasmic binding protein CopC [Devosia sp.]|nr:copper homeostasis periplasmic binding protein CopC [Devosia sp.]